MSDLLLVQVASKSITCTAPVTHWLRHNTSRMLHVATNSVTCRSEDDSRSVRGQTTSISLIIIRLATSLDTFCSAPAAEPQTVQSEDLQQMEHCSASRRRCEGLQPCTIAINFYTIQHQVSDMTSISLSHCQAQPLPQPNLLFTLGRDRAKRHFDSSLQ